MYRKRVTDNCGEPSYQVDSHAKYINPHDHRDAMSVVEIDYGKVSEFTRMRYYGFVFFLYMILLIWYITLVAELSRIIHLCNLLINFKTDKDYAILSERMRSGIRTSLSTLSVDSSGTFTSRWLRSPRNFDGQSPRVDGVEVMTDISRPHRIVIMLTVFLRFSVWTYMANVGTTFLLATPGYDDLLMNAVALAFIFDLPDFFYALLVSDEMKVQLDGAKTAEFPTSLPTEGWRLLLISRAFWGLCVIPIATFVVILYHYEHNTEPALEALECACLQKGLNCVGAARFTREWWDGYWQETFPLAVLRSSYN